MCKLLMLLNVDTHILINGKHKQILICFNLVTLEFFWSSKSFIPTVGLQLRTDSVKFCERKSGGL